MTKTETHDPATGEIMTIEAQAMPPALSHAETEWRLVERKALALSKAGTAIPRHFSGKPADILAAWMLGDELGISRMSMLRGAYVVNGKPSLSGDLLLAVARGAGVRVAETVEGEGEEMVATCTATLPSGEEITRTFSVTDAMQAGLWGSSDPWKKYPKRMLVMRARGFCLRDAVPDKLAGVYAEGELIDVTPVDAES